MAAMADTDVGGVPERRAALSTSACVGWGIGTLAVAALFNSVNVLLLRYLVDFVGLGAALAGSLIGFSKIYDVIVDPAVGTLSDRVRSPIGRRRPFMLAGGLMLALASVALFNVPGGLSPAMRLAYVIGTLLLYATGYAAFSVPYMAMPAEMTTDPQERSRLISYRIYAVAIASMISTFVGPVLIARGGGGQAGHTVMSLFIALIVLLSTIASFRLTRSAPFHYAEATVRIGLWRKLVMLAENRPFMVMLAIKLFQLTALAVTQAATPFLFKSVLKLSDTMLGAYFLVFYGSMIVMQKVWLRLGARFGKRDSFLWTCLVYALLYLSWYFVHPGEPVALVLLRGFVLGSFGGATLLFGQSLLPDTMEWDYRRTGLRREGLLSAVYTMIEKLSYALGAAITGIVLGFSGYVQGMGKTLGVQPASAVEAMYWLGSILPMLLLLASCFALLFYDLTEAKLKEAGQQG